ncbi:MAG: DegT/DnrJ/EryC1/StrS aminotransferase family protein [Bacteroidales bacterium]|nr:DegT/DnrJ/EryC1/StrS aminotransferase family protein [Bacteroidales bacterium]
MSLRLIPRIRVNYGFTDLIRAMFTGESKQSARQECEKVLSSFFDGEYVCLVPSARDAIYELLIRLPQKKVVLPAYTCIAVVEAVKLAGKEMIFCETDSITYNSSYLEAITPDCIVLATHQYGLPCNIEEIMAKCKETGAVLIEDCATSMGTTVNGKRTGTFGEYAMVSFNASKLINVPPVAGVLVSKNKDMVDLICKDAEWRPSDFLFKVKAMIRGLAYVMTKNTVIYKLFHYFAIGSKGKLQKTRHEKPAEKKTPLYSYRFAEWQAVILLRQLKRLEALFAKRRELYAYYDKNIHNPIVQKPIMDENAVCCRYAVQVNDQKAFYKECIKNGVDMDFSHIALGCPDSFEDEHRIASRILNLPYYYDLSRKEVEKIVNTVNHVSL